MNEEKLKEALKKQSRIIKALQKNISPIYPNVNLETAITFFFEDFDTMKEKVTILEKEKMKMTKECYVNEEIKRLTKIIKFMERELYYLNIPT